MRVFHCIRKYLKERKKNLENLYMEEKDEINWKESQNLINTRFHTAKLTMLLLWKERSTRKWSHKNLAKDSCHWEVFFEKGVRFFPGKDIVTPQSDWRTAPVVGFSVIKRTYMFFHLLILKYLSTKNTCFSTERFVSSCTSANSSDFQGSKVNFAALFCCFCKNIYFSPADLFFFLE